MSARSSGNKRLVEKLKKLGDYSQDTDEVLWRNNSYISVM
jgi:hypothetical protein